MGKRVIIIHLWDVKPDDDWYPWLKRELEKRGNEVMVPEMPQTEAPVIQEWVEKITQVIGKPDEQTVLVGHSIGCQTIIRYLETLNEDQKAGGVLLVAPWIHLVNLEDAESERIAKPWIETPIDWDKTKMHAGKITCLLSDNDPWVPVTEAIIFENNLGAAVKILPNQGHFTDKTSRVIRDVVINYSQ